jgi:hypothetical protein
LGYKVIWHLTNDWNSLKLTWKLNFSHCLFGEVARQHEAWISAAFEGRSASDVVTLHHLLGRV